MSDRVSLPQLRRECGTCTACCHAYAIPEIEKPAFSLCHQCRPDSDRPCSVYEMRPKRCRDFRCFYLDPQRRDIAGVFRDESRRPDRLGLVFSISGNRENFVAHVSRPDAEKTPEAIDVVSEIRSLGFGVIIVPSVDGVRRYLPPLWNPSR